MGEETGRAAPTTGDLRRLLEFNNEVLSKAAEDRRLNI
jgi:hypothetical protein